jgi:hypothetical protein
LSKNAGAGIREFFCPERATDTRLETGFHPADARIMKSRPRQAGRIQDAEGNGALRSEKRPSPDIPWALYMARFISGSQIAKCGYSDSARH